MSSRPISGGPRLPSLLDPPVVFAEGGASAQLPPQSHDAYDTAVRLGATGLTGTVWRADDGRAVVGAVAAGRGVLRRRAPARLPLEDLAARCGTDLHLTLDVADPDAVPEAIATVRDHPDLERRLWLTHEDRAVLAGWRELSGTLRLVHRARLDRLPTGPEAHAAALRRLGVDALDLHESEWTGGTITLVHRFELLAVAHDAQHERTIDAALDAGIDALRGRHVDRLVDGLRARRRG